MSSLYTPPNEPCAAPPSSWDTVPPLPSIDSVPVVKPLLAGPVNFTGSCTSVTALPGIVIEHE